MKDQRPTFSEVASKVLAERRRSRLKKQQGEERLPVKAWEYPVPKVPTNGPAADGTAD